MLNQAVRRTRRPKRDLSNPRVIAYLRVSTDEQSASGAGMDAQRAAIQLEAQRRGWLDVEWIEDAGYSARNLDRPGIQRAMLALDKGKADVLVVSKLDRLSRSLFDFAGLMAESERAGWSLVALDLGVDTTTTQGRMMAGVLAVFAEFERGLISDRTKAGLAAKKAQGVRVGRPNSIPQPIRDRIAAEREAGETYDAIARRLTAEGVPTGRGGVRWYPSTVHAALKAL